MNNFNKIVKNVLVFLIIFMAVNYIFQSCTKKQEVATQNPGVLVFHTTKNEYTRTDIVTVEIINNTDQTVTIINECPKQPFNVYKSEKNAWTPKTDTPKLDCSNAKNIVLPPTKTALVPYESWNHVLFGDMGRFKIDTKIKVKDEEKVYTTNEFTVVQEGILSQLWQALFYRPIYNGLIFLVNVLPFHDLGFAIIILTIIIRTILLVPSHKSMKAQKKMQEINPRIEKIKEMYKGDQQKIATETMALWKEAKVNPFGSCLPLLLQFPFLIALFYVIQKGLNPDNTYLLYTTYKNFSLADININFFGILDLTKINFYVLPIIIGGLQFLQMKLAFARNNKKKDKDGEKKETKKNEMAMANNMMTYIMPVMVAVFTAGLPAGVGLYWGISTIYGIVQQIYVNRGGTKKDGESEATVRVISN